MSSQQPVAFGLITAIRHESEVLVTGIALVAMLAHTVPKTAAHRSSAAMITIEDALTTGSPTSLSVLHASRGIFWYDFNLAVGKLSRLLWLVL